MKPITLLSPDQQFGLATECGRWKTFAGTDSKGILASLRVCSDKNVSLAIAGGGTVTLKGVYPPHARSPLLVPFTEARAVAANLGAYPLRPCIQGTYVDPETGVLFPDCFADVVCTFVRVDAAGVAITEPVVLLQWHETEGLDKCNAVAPCALTYLGIRYSVLRLRDSARLVTRSSPVAVVTAPLAPLLTARQQPEVTIRGYAKPPQRVAPLLAAHLFGGMHTT
jgi:hypothetical protein